MKTTREVITPAKARAWLELNVSNRNFSQSTAEGYAAEMKQARWKDTGEPYHFSLGLLVNGQHRLWAIAQSGVSLEQVVIRDYPQEDVPALDIGRSRSASDVLSMKGYANSKYCASAVRICEAIRNGIVTRASRRKLSPPEVLQLVQSEYRGIEEFVALATSRGNKTPIGRATFAALIHEFARKERITASLFADVLSGHATVAVKHPFHVLRERLLSRQRDGSNGDNTLVLALCIKAWNMVREGKQTITVLKFTVAEAYPEIK